MTRIGSQLVFCSPNCILRRTAVERDERNCVTTLISLDDSFVESSHTLFFDGIISAEIVSLKQHLKPEKIAELVKDYRYYDFSKDVPSVDTSIPEKAYLFDFGTNSNSEVSTKLTTLAKLHPGISVFDIIAACVYYPALVLGLPGELTVTRNTELILWENIDLVSKLLTVSSSIRGF